MTETKNNSSSSSHSTATFIVGIIIGAAVTYLFTTEEGKKLKDKLIKEASRLFSQLGEGVQEIEEKVKEEAAQAQEKIDQEVQELPKHIGEIQKKGRRFFFRRPHAMDS